MCDIKHLKIFHPWELPRIFCGSERARWTVRRWKLKFSITTSFRFLSLKPPFASTTATLLIAEQFSTSTLFSPNWPATSKPIFSAFRPAHLISQSAGSRLVKSPDYSVSSLTGPRVNNKNTRGYVFHAPVSDKYARAEFFNSCFLFFRFLVTEPSLDGSEKDGWGRRESRGLFAVRDDMSELSQASRLSDASGNSSLKSRKRTCI